MSTPVKYLKDENNTTFSPVVSVDSIVTTGGGKLVDYIYPVGSIYMSVNSTNPSQLFGGTWEQIKGKFLLGVDPGDEQGRWDGVNMTGGTDAVTLQTRHLPSHNHKVVGYTSQDGQHLHGISAANGLGHLEWGFVFSYDGHNAAYNTGASNTDGAHQHYIDITSQNTGSDNAFSIMPPFYTVYIWKRTK